MRENQRGTGPYSDHAYKATQQGRSLHDNNLEPSNLKKQDDKNRNSTELISSSEGMQYLDIIQRFAL